MELGLQMAVGCLVGAGDFQELCGLSIPPSLFLRGAFLFLFGLIFVFDTSHAAQGDLKLPVYPNP